MPFITNPLPLLPYERGLPRTLIRPILSPLVNALTFLLRSSNKSCYFQCCSLSTISHWAPLECKKIVKLFWASYSCTNVFKDIISFHIMEQIWKEQHVKTACQILCLFYIRRPVPDHRIGWKVFQNFHKILIISCSRPNLCESSYLIANVTFDDIF